MKIGIKLTTIMMVMSLSSILAIGVVLLARSRSIISDLAYTNATIAGNEAAVEVTEFFEPFWEAMKTTATIMERYDFITINNRRTYFNAILRELAAGSSEILGIWCLWEPDVLEGDDSQYIGTTGTTPEGRFAPYWFRSDGKIDIDLLVDFDKPGAGDYYLLARNNNAITMLEPYEYNVGGKIILLTSISAPIRSADNRVLGVVGVDISIEKIQEISQGIKPYPDATSAVFSNQGTIVAHFDPSRLGKYLQDTEKDMLGPEIANVTRAVRNGEQYIFNTRVGSNETHQVFTPVKVAESTTPWSLAVGVSPKTILAPVTMMMEIALIISVVLLIVIVAVSIILARSISKPIIKVADTLKDISEGEGDLTRTIPEKGKDEIADLSRYFNQTIGKIRALVFAIKSQAGQLSGIGVELSTNMTEAAAAINEITANIQSIKGRMINQSASVTETNATMEQITVNINKLNRHVESQADSVSRSSSAIEQMLANIQSVTQTLIKNGDNVKELTEASDIGRTGLQDVAADIQEIAKESEGLMEINSVMENIASQTNLLSMNAAIEAAHAGEAGKGFAVVADEIRKLAENSSEQSKTISSVLKKIKTSIDKITLSTDNVLTRFEAIDKEVKTVAEQEANIRAAMEEQGQGSKQILDAIGQVHNTTQLVKDGSNEMLEGSAEVIKESKNLEKATQEVTGGMNEMASGAEQINVAVHRVNELSGQNKENIDQLVKEVSKFKVD
ncbi:MAG: methyl-accepting chemotaxis protein [Treponema sp.]|nr:methyl-accepting chemotaxis protein [Treponema sp.]